jgi:hypothetical protein
MAKRMSTNFLVLPCCAYDLFGKFDRDMAFHGRGAKKSLFSTYLDFVEELTVSLQFSTIRDRMRIPSPKSTCIIGIYQQPYLSSADVESLCVLPIEQARRRAFHAAKTGRLRHIFESAKVSPNETITSMDDEDSQIDFSMDTSCDNFGMAAVRSTDDAKAFVTFEPRSAEIPVLNCTRIDETVKQRLVQQIADYLLTLPPIDPNSVWRTGGRADIHDIAGHINEDLKQHLRSQGNGIATLIRNYSYVFRFQRYNNRPMVTLRDYRTDPNSNIPRRFKCWFDQFHPDGCPLMAANCIYEHSTGK